MRAPEFIVSPEILKDEDICLDSREHFHMVRVRRLEAGSVVRLVDGLGSLVHARIKEIHADRVILKRSGPVETADDLVPLRMILPIIKGERMDQAVLQLSEMGVGLIQPVLTSRTIVRADSSRLSRKWERWQSLSLHGLKQCRGIKTARVLKPCTVQEVLSGLSDSGFKIVLSEKHMDISLLELLQGKEQPFPITAAVGPEGGFSREETALFIGRGFEPAGLGPRILRSGTAAVYSAAVISQFFWSAKQI